MTPRPERFDISPNRLFAAADELLKAIRSPRGLDAPIRMYTGVARDERSLPARAFTPGELLEAMDALIRMGFVTADLPG